MKIDIFNHFLPRPYFDALQTEAGEHPIVRDAARKMKLQAKQQA